MPKKMIVSIVLLLILIVMIADFRINNIKVFESYFRQMETSSLRGLQQGNLNLSDFQGLKTVINTNGQIIDIADKDITGLMINNQLGSVIITGEDRQDLELNYRITIYSEKELVDDSLKNMKIISNYNGNNLELTRERMELPPFVRGIKIDYEIRVPRELALDISNRYGQLVVSGMKSDVDLDNYYDQLRVTAIDGEAELLARYGSLFVENVSGPVQINTAYNNAEIYNLGAGLDLNSRYGSVRIDGIRGSTDLDFSYGSLSIENVEKDVSIKSRFTQVRGQAIKGNLKGEMQYGNLDLMDVTTSVDIRGRYTNLNIDLANSLADYQVICNTQYGEIKTNLPYRVEEENSHRTLEGTKGDGRIEINLETERANITVYQ